MENCENGICTDPGHAVFENRLPNERIDKMKVFAIVAISKELPIDLIKDKMFLSLVGAYTAL